MRAVPWAKVAVPKTVSDTTFRSKTWSSYLLGPIRTTAGRGSAAWQASFFDMGHKRFGVLTRPSGTALSSPTASEPKLKKSPKSPKTPKRPKSPKGKRSGSPRKGGLTDRQSGTAVLHIIASDEDRPLSPSTSEPEATGAPVPSGATSLAARLARRRLERSEALHSLVAEQLSVADSEQGSDGISERASARELLDDVFGTSLRDAWDAETPRYSYRRHGAAEAGDEGVRSAASDAIDAAAASSSAAAPATNRKRAVAKRVTKPPADPEYEQNVPWMEDSDGRRTAKQGWVEDQMKLTLELQRQYGLPISK